MRLGGCTLDRVLERTQKSARMVGHGLNGKAESAVAQWHAWVEANEGDELEVRMVAQLTYASEVGRKALWT